MTAFEHIPTQAIIVARLWASLERHGHHTAGCSSYAAGKWMFADTEHCGCGLTSALRAAKP